MTTGTGAERRKHPRVQKRLLLKYRCVKGAVIGDAVDQVGALEDVSKGGMILKAKKVYEPGCVLRLYFPEGPLGPARTLHARVVRAKPSPGGDGFQMGLQFVKYEEAAAAVMTEAQKARTTRRYESTDLGPGAERRTKRFTEKSSEKKDGADRRRHPRWEQRILVKYRCVTKGVMYEVDERVGMLLDFSRGGLVIMSLREYAKGNVLLVKLPESPLGPAQTVHLRVLWTGPHDKPGQYKVGGDFVKPAE